ncbi:MAG: XRE family transcriptional regulator [Leptospirales bacterium]
MPDYSIILEKNMSIEQVYKRDLYNPEMLILARESRSLSQKDLSEITELPQSKISKYESHIFIPTEEDIKILAAKLDYPISFFTLNHIRQNDHLDLYRKQRSTMKSLQLKEVKAMINIYRIRLSYLLQAVNFNVNLHDINVDEENTPQMIAQKIRNYWRVPDGPINNLVKFIESTGIIVIYTTIGESIKFSGCSFYVGHVPIVIVNRHDPVDRIRFTIAHEIGHIIMHHNAQIILDEKEAEKQADSFASEFLAPENEIGIQLRDLSFDRLLQLKYHWKMSMASLIEKAKHLNKLSDSQYRYIRGRYCNKFKNGEPGKLPYENSNTLNNIVDIYKKDLQYTDNDLQEILHSHNIDLKSMFMYDNNLNLRIVR